MLLTPAISEFLRDFVFVDCPLGGHPKVRSRVWRATDRGQVLIGASPDRHWADLSSHGLTLLEEPLSSDSFARVEGSTVFRSFPLPSDLRGSTASDLLQTDERHSWLETPIGRVSEANGRLILDIGVVPISDTDALGTAQLLASILSYLLLHPRNRRTVTPESVALGEALKRIRTDLGLTQGSLASSIGVTRVALSRWEAGAQCPSPGRLYAWCRGLGLVQSPKAAIVKVVDVSSSLEQLLREDPTYLRRLSPTEFEHFVADRLRRMGFEVTLVGGTFAPDGGIDLVASRHVPGVGPFLIAGQIKHHAGGRKTDRTAVDRLLSWQGSEFQLGLLVTNTEFTRHALWAAQQDRNRTFLRLRDFDDLKRWIEGDFWCEEDWIQIPDEVEVAPGIKIAIPKPKIRTWRNIWPDAEISTADRT